MNQKTLGILQINIGVIFFVLLILGLIVDIMVGESVSGIILGRDSIMFLLFGIFALTTGWYNLKNKNSIE